MHFYKHKCPMSSMTNNPLEMSSYYSHLSMMPTLMNTAPKLPPNLYRPNSWMDPSMQPFFYYNLALNDPNHKRKNATRETTATLKAWLYEHRKNPYPTKNEKMVLAMVTKMTLTQVSTWFANARRRLKKENKLHRTTNNSKSEEDDDEDDDDEEDENDGEQSVEDEDQNENENDSHVEIEEEQTVESNHAKPTLKRKRDETEQETKSLQAPPSQRPKIWSIVDVVQSNENKRSKPLPCAPIIHPYITPSMPYLLYPSVPLPPASTSSPSHSSEHSTHSLLSPTSSSSSSSSSSASSSATTSASCSPTK